MGTHPTDTDSDDPLEIYDALVMAGQAPNPAEFAARYPERPDLLERIEAIDALRHDLDAMVDHIAEPSGERPAEVGGFRLLELLGRGGMGEVYLAEEIATGNKRALKLVRRVSPTALQRFEREARLASGLSHAGIARVLDWGVQADHAYLVAELVPGSSLKDLQRAGRFPGPSAVGRLRLEVGLAAQVAEALAYAHARGVVHRDVKPSNIMLTEDGTARLIDFGIALEVERRERITRTGVFVGSHDYAAPEQLRGDKRSIGPWTDTYALGATLYELLGGRPPFDGLSLGPRIARAGDKPDNGPRALNPDVPRALDALVMRALHPSAKKRFRDGQHMLEAVRAWLGRAPAGV